MAPLRDACILACIASYGQGMALLQEASKLHDYNLDFSAIGQIWKGAASSGPGCCNASRTPTAPIPPCPT